MSPDITVEATARSDRGKNNARRLRRRGQVPAVLYGEGKEAVPLSLDARHIDQILNSATGHNTIFQVAVDTGERQAAMLVDWQLDPLRDCLLHVDLKRIDLERKLRAMVPIVAQGEAKGVKTQGGLLEVVTREVEVECLPKDIPEHIVVDVSELEVGKSIRARDIPATATYHVTSDGDKVLAHVIIMKEEEEKPAEVAVEGAVAAAPVEPEVIKKGKKEEEGEAEEPVKETKEAKEQKGKK